MVLTAELLLPVDAVSKVKGWRRDYAYVVLT